MESTRFDHVARLLAARRTRRSLALAGGAAALGLAAAKAQDATPEGDTAGATPAAVATPTAAVPEKISYLFVQSFQAGSIAPGTGGANNFTVTLEQGSGQTLYFADRPSRDVGAVATPAFLNGLGFAADDPPNAALLVETTPGETTIAVVELTNPVASDDGYTVSYDLNVLSDWEQSLDLAFSESPADLATLAPTFGSAHLLIDDCPNGTITCQNPDAVIGTFADVPACWNYAACIPCEPYGHTEPYRCATLDYWNTKCVQQFAACQNDGECVALYSWDDTICGVSAGSSG